MAKLTARQQRFVDEYLVDLNATQAAIRAGYSAKTAAVIGAENLAKPNIAAEVTKRQQVRSIRTEITQDRVLKELTKIAFASGSDFAKIATRTRKKYILNDKTGEYEEKEIDEQSVELYDTDILSPDKKAAIAEISEGKYGITVKSYDKVKALELLGRHLGMFTDKVEVSGTINNPYKDLTLEQLKKLAGEVDGTD